MRPAGLLEAALRRKLGACAVPGLEAGVSKQSSWCSACRPWKACNRRRTPVAAVGRRGTGKPGQRQQPAAEQHRASRSICGRAARRGLAAQLRACQAPRRAASPAASSPRSGRRWTSMRSSCARCTSCTCRGTRQNRLRGWGNRADMGVRAMGGRKGCAADMAHAMHAGRAPLSGRQLLQQFKNPEPHSLWQWSQMLAACRQAGWRGQRKVGK